MRVRIDHLDANPFRHIDRYPIREEKITALVESINSTGFWDNMVGRVVGDRVQIAYGHHRREALRRTYGPDYEVGIVVRDFTDDQMLQIMARENMEEWGSSAWVEMETVRAVVEAYGAGQITLAKPAENNRRNWRVAPSFVLGERPRTPASAPYTAQEVAAFLGWTKPSGEAQGKVLTALAALALIEQGHLVDANFAGMSTSQAEALVRETHDVLREQEKARQAEAARLAALEAERKAIEVRAARAAEERAAALARAREAREQDDRQQAEREAEAQSRLAAQAEQERIYAQRLREAAQRDVQRLEAERTHVRNQVTRSMQTNLRNPNVGIDRARKEAQATRAKYAPDNSAPIDFGRFIRGLASRLSRLLTQGDFADALAQIRRHRKHIPTADGDQLVAALEEMRKLIDTHLALLGASQAPTLDVEVIDAELID